MQSPCRNPTRKLSAFLAGLAALWMTALAPAALAGTAAPALTPGGSTFGYGSGCAGATWAQVVVPGQPLTLTGYGLGDTPGQVEIAIGAYAAPVTVDSWTATKLVVTIPPGFDSNREAALSIQTSSCGLIGGDIHIGADSQPSATNPAPVARATVHEVRRSRTYVLSSSRSSADTGARLVSFRWTMGRHVLGNDPTLRHRFRPGFRVIKLVVTDSRGDIASTALLLRVR